MNFLINLKYNIFKFSPYIAALGTTLIWMDEFSDFHVIGRPVVEYPVLAHVPFSMLLVALMAWRFIPPPSIRKNHERMSIIWLGQKPHRREFD